MIDICLDGPIGSEPGEISAAMVKSQLARAGGQPITVRIHSEGGSVFEGFALYDAFKAYPGVKRCLVESAAFSIASLVAMAFDDRQITQNGYLMIHNPAVEGETDQPPVIEQLRQRMVSIYATAARVSSATIKSMMDSETFLDATESMRAGFITAIAPATVRAVARHRTLARAHTGLAAAIVARSSNPSAQWRAAVKAAMATGLSNYAAVAAVERRHPGLRQKMVDEANRK